MAAAFFPSAGGPRQAPPYSIAGHIAQAAGGHVEAVLGEFGEAFEKVLEFVSAVLSDKESTRLVRERAVHPFQGGGERKDHVADLQRSAAAVRGHMLLRKSEKSAGLRRESRLTKREVNGLDAECNSVGRLYELLTVGPLRICAGAVIPVSEHRALYDTWPACESCSTSNDEESLACQSKCCSAVDTIGASAICRCPADYSGYMCETKRPWSCALELLSPDLRCSSPTAPIQIDTYGDSTCFKFLRRDENAKLAFRASCVTAGTMMDTGDSQFAYYLKTDKLALSEDPKMKAVSRPFNFYRMSDDSAAKSVLVSRDTYTGGENIEFTFNLSALTTKPRSFFSGGRLYVETGLVPTEGGSSYFGQKPGAVHRTFLDFYDIPIAAPDPVNVPGDGIEAALVVIVIVVSLSAVGFAVFVFNRVTKKRKGE